MASILIVDDDEHFRHVLARLLEAAGHVVSTARDGIEGARLYHAHPTDLIITDMIMPHNGLSMLRALRSHDPSVRVIAMTGRGTQRLDYARALGAQAWRLVDHLSLNYLSLLDGEGSEGAEAMRSLLSLYCDLNDPALLSPPPDGGSGLPVYTTGANGATSVWASEIQQLAEQSVRAIPVVTAEEAKAMARTNLAAWARAGKVDAVVTTIAAPVQPLSAGGDNHHLNLRWLCRAHNLGRGARQALLAFVARARDQRPPDAGLAQEVDHLLQRHALPGVVAVVQVRIEDRQRLRIRSSKKKHREHDEGAHSTVYSHKRMPVTPPRTLTELFLGFLSIGARSFGGVLPWAHRVMVEERRWLAPADFAETIGLCQFLPGPNVGNASIVLGKRWFGVRGALVAFLGLVALPFVWVLALGAIYADFAEVPMVKGVVTGVGAAGAGLFIGTAVKLGRVLVRKPVALALVAACFIAVALGRVSLLYVLPVALVLAILASRKAWL